ncbi:MAG: beta-ketoacyl-ACP synthase II [Bacteroidales bacterium]|nr:beta-ketoacyl-ACP synthase II [Bacteroidales bacterium]
MGNKRRVVVTGLGVVSPVGSNVETFWQNLLDGYCGIETITRFDTSDMPIKVAAFVKDFEPSDFGIEPAVVRKHDRFAVFAAAASAQAVKQSGLDSSEGGNIDPMRFGVYMGTGIGGFETIYRECHKMATEGPKWVSPQFIPSIIGNIASGLIAIRHNACGPCLPAVTACATSTHEIGEAFRAIKFGYADAIIAGGAEAPLIPIGVAGFANMKALNKETDPKRACLPFSADRAGFVMGEGAAALVLEEYEHAKARGAEILAEVVGYGNTCDAHHITAPRPDGVTQARCIKDALNEACFDSSKDELYINAHGTGTHLNDISETMAYKVALGDYAYKAHISSTKSMTGHMFGAAGAVEAAVSVLALKNGVVPPTIGLDNPDPECDLDYTPGKAVKADLTIAISDSLGFGGHNGCVAFRKL